LRGSRTDFKSPEEPVFFDIGRRAASEDGDRRVLMVTNLGS
jgi:hypothetical protein